LGYSYNDINFSSDFKNFSVSYSNIQENPVSLIYKLDENEWKEFKIFDLKYNIDSNFYLTIPKIFNFQSENDKLYGCYYLPENYNSNNGTFLLIIEYPTVLYIYGGPHV
jgi:dipeptidyl aminopeptidase/acylaminoacyl peptidase